MKKNLFLLHILLILCNCSTPQTKPTALKPTETKASKHITLENDQLDSAIQAYEAGKYENALKILSTLNKKDATLRDFHLVPYYQGLIHYSLNEYQEASDFLEQFVKENPNSKLLPNTYITLLICYKALSLWKKMVTLATEAQNISMYYDNKVLIKLLWVEALIRTGQQLGGKEALGEAEELLDSATENRIQESKENFASLKGRFIWLRTYHILRKCEAIPPPKNINLQQASKKIYTWFEERGLCLNKALTIALPAFLQLNNYWSRTLSNSIQESLQSYFNAPDQLTKLKVITNPLYAYESARPVIRQQFYKMLDHFNQVGGSKKLPTGHQESLEYIQATVEYFLQRISVLSSSTDRTL